VARPRTIGRLNILPSVVRPYFHLPAKGKSPTDRIARSYGVSRVTIGRLQGPFCALSTARASPQHEAQYRPVKSKRYLPGCYSEDGSRVRRGTGVFHRSLWDFCNNQLFFYRSHNAGRVFLFPCRTGTTYRGPHDHFNISSDSAVDVWRSWRS